MTGTGKTTRSVSLTGTQQIDALIYGEAWAGSTVTYAFPTSASSYNYYGEPDNNFETLSSRQQSAVRFALDTAYGGRANDGFSVEGFTNLTVSVGSATTATLRYAQSDEALPTAYGYLPSTSAWGGDVWISSASANRSPAAGNYAWLVMLHETGHALGLKHGHVAEYGSPALPSSYDSMEYSIMTYHSYIGERSTSGFMNETYGFAQTFMMLDIAALQEIYGADYTTNAGDTVYKWKPSSGDTYVNGEVAIDAAANRIFATIWDGGGSDTYDLTAYSSAVNIDLRPGKYSITSEAQLAYLGGGPNQGNSRGNVFNALLHDSDTRSLIENAYGGSGSDTIRGNVGSNKLSGYSGADKLYGDAAKDVLFGGAGNDRLYGQSGNDILYGGTGTDRLSGGDGYDDFVFRKGYGKDWILDFEDGTDDIDLRAYSYSGVDQVLDKASQSNDDVIIKFTSSDILVVADFLLKNLGAGDFLL
ncbi:M10 family metallopeptidase [Sinorhizobium sp. BG8]|uniref:M10 family metallopeptidase n=1 Tax=Sinorhizobium sp. BG8 TaxID=2613773 RepID=UPI00193CFAFE|nr:M10 family metallopeptidase [Sinorhizobium sp. BG8]